MHFGLCETAQPSMRPNSNVITTDLLQNAINEHSNWAYSVTETEKGWLLKPNFRDAPYRNGFVPEIQLTRSWEDEKTLLFTGQLPKATKIFVLCWFGAVLTMQTLILMLAVFSNLEISWSTFIPVGLCLFGYLICKLGMKEPFYTAVRAIRKSFP